jgi:hypothetical protein
MALSRRELLKTAGTFALVGGLPLSLTDIALGRQAGGAAPLGSRVDVPLPGQKPADPLGSFTMATFAGVVRTDFRVRGKQREAKLALVEVKSLTPPDAARPHQECFSLLFRNSRCQPLPQDTYRMEHPALGAFDLFLVPMANNGGVLNHVAIINRRLS